MGKLYCDCEKNCRIFLQLSLFGLGLFIQNFLNSGWTWTEFPNSGIIWIVKYVTALIYGVWPHQRTHPGLPRQKPSLNQMMNVKDS